LKNFGENRFFLLQQCFFILFLFLTSQLSAHSIVFVHIGPSLPGYLSTTISQARLFNKECPIYLISSQVAIEAASSGFLESQVTFIPCESLISSQTHEKFRNSPSHNWSGNGFWVYTSERFFYLEEFVRQYQLSNVIHLENDIMLYVDLHQILPTLKNRYKGMIAATFENDHRCVPGFFYISHSEPLTALIEFFPKSIVDYKNSDMETIARFKENFHGRLIEYLPIVAPEYADDHSMEVFGIKSKNPMLFSNHFDEFGSIFDAAAWGVYLGGRDAVFHEDSNPGKILPYCIFSPLDFHFNWKVDQEGRRVPFVTYKGKQVPINNLHITNKEKIPLFHSLQR
jgi:hypothetical protein